MRSGSYVIHVLRLMVENHHLTDESEYMKGLEFEPDTIKSRNGLKALLLCNLHISVL